MTCGDVAPTVQAVDLITGTWKCSEVMVRQPEKTLRLTTALKGEETGCEGQTKAWPFLWLRETRNLYVGKGMGSGVRVQTFP